MKRIFFLCILAITKSIYAQISINRSDLPKPSANSPLPDSTLYTAVTGNISDAYKSKGTNMVWDASNMSGNIRWQYFLPMSQTPLIFQLLFFGSDFVQPLSGSTALVGGVLSEAFEYYQYANNNQRLQIRGFGGNLTLPGQNTPVPLPALYTSPDVLYTLPMEYGNIDSSISGYSLPVPVGGAIGNITVKRNQKRVNEVDAWGNITVPSGGSYEVIRHTSKIYRVDSLITDFFPLGFPSRLVEYKWFAKGQTIPVLQINGNLSANGNNVTVTSAQYIGGWPSVIEENSVKSSPIVLYPNPTRNVISLQINPINNSNKADIYIYDMQGKKMSEWHFTLSQNNNSELTIPVQYLAKGIYHLQYICENKSRSMTFTKE